MLARVGLIALACLAVACQQRPPPLPDPGPRAALARTIQQVVLPTYQELDEGVRELAAQLAALGPASAASDLARLRDAYRSARLPLEEADAFAFGPAVELGSSLLLDPFPIDAATIDAELQGPAPLTPAYLRSLRASARGLHGAEYLLFPEDDVKLDLHLLEDSEAGARRRQYLSSIGQIVAEAARELHQAWAPQHGDYGRRFSEPGEPDSVLGTAQAGIDLLLMESVFLSEHVADTKLGRPRRRAGVAATAGSAGESVRAGMSLSDARSNLRGMRNVYQGARDGSAGPSISSLVRASRASADAHVLTAFDAAELALAAMPEPPSEPYAAGAPADAAFEAIKHLRRLLATEVLGALGSSLALDIHDGD